jgi:putative hydrolase of the HAD superfamily
LRRHETPAAGSAPRPSPREGPDPLGGGRHARCLLLDLDGVLRYWDPAIIVRAERRHRLPAGAIAAAAFRDTALLHRAITGELSDEAWRAEITSRLAVRHGPAAALAVRDWSRSVGRVVPEVLGIVREVRSRGVPVALLSNATSRLDRDLRRLRLDRELDLVLSTSALGTAKPEPAAFLAACRELGVDPHDCAFVDDTAANTGAASSLGMAAHLYSDPAGLRAFLRSVGLANRS